MPSISHRRPQDRQQLQQGKTFPSPSLENLQPELDKHPPGEGRAGRALGQRGVPSDFGNVSDIAELLYIEHRTLKNLTSKQTNPQPPPTKTKPEHLHKFSPSRCNTQKKKKNCKWQTNRNSSRNGEQ